MTSSLIAHDQLQYFISFDGEKDVWHRAYGFADGAIDLPTLAKEMKEATGISLMQEQADEEVHGFISCARVPRGVSGNCSWCLDEGEKGKHHTCIIITLFTEHLSEEPIVEEALTHILCNYHQSITERNISLLTPQAP